MDVSVVIVNWNTKELLENCLSTLYAHTKGVVFEVIVVDNASSDNSAAMVKDKFAQTIIIENNKNLGYATANNKGIAIARGRYVLVLNSDVIFIEDAIAKVCAVADNHRDVAVFGCKLLNRDMTLQESTFMFPSILNLFLAITFLSHIFPKSKFFARERMWWWDWNDEREVDVVGGCFMFVRMSAVADIGMMDTNFFMYFEETDWCYRFRKSGWKNLYTPAAQLVHLGGGSSKKNPDKFFLQLNSSMLLYFLKHKGRLHYMAACFLLIVFFLIRIPYWFIHSFLSWKTMNADLNTSHLYAVAMLKTFRGWRGLRIDV